VSTGTDLKRHLALLVELHQSLVDRQGRAARRKTQHELLVFRFLVERVYSAYNVLGDLTSVSDSPIESHST
jgi:hypothetical protein